MVDDAYNILPPVDVIRERRLAEITGFALRVVDRDEYLKKKQSVHKCQSVIYTIDEISVKYKSIVNRSTKYIVSRASPLTGARW